jgi:hypothetical protein
MDFGVGGGKASVGGTGGWEEYVAAAMLGVGVDCVAVADVNVSELRSGVFHICHCS